MESLTTINRSYKRPSGDTDRFPRCILSEKKNEAIMHYRENDPTGSFGRGEKAHRENTQRMITKTEIVGISSFQTCWFSLCFFLLTEISYSALHA